MEGIKERRNKIEEYTQLSGENTENTWEIYSIYRLTKVSLPTKEEAKNSWDYAAKKK